MPLDASAACRSSAAVYRVERSSLRGGRSLLRGARSVLRRGCSLGQFISWELLPPRFHALRGGDGWIILPRQRRPDLDFSHIHSPGGTG